MLTIILSVAFVFISLVLFFKYLNMVVYNASVKASYDMAKKIIDAFNEQIKNRAEEEDNG